MYMYVYNHTNIDVSTCTYAHIVYSVEFVVLLQGWLSQDFPLPFPFVILGKSQSTNKGRYKYYWIRYLRYTDRKLSLISQDNQTNVGKIHRK